MPVQLQDWQAPYQAVSEDKKVGWLRESTEDGMIAKKRNRGYTDYAKFMDVIAGRISLDDLLDYRSSVNSNELKTNMKQVIGAQAKLRPIWGYSTGHDGFRENAEMMNKVTRAIYLETFADRKIKEALQWAAATTRGFVRPVYQKDLSSGHNHIQHLTYGDPSIIPVQMPSGGFDLQKAYTVHIMHEMPIFEAHSRFPRFQDQLKPANSRYWHDGDILKTAKVSKGHWWNYLSGRKPREQEEGSNLFLPIRYSYIVDLTINETGQEIPMGEYGTTWYYKVPYVGQEIVRNGEKKKADEQDARLYPLRRLMISAPSCECVMYDDTAFDWHGMVPLIPFAFDEWVWGDAFGLVHDGYELQRAMTKIERGSMDKIGAQLDLPLGYDINSVTKKEAEQFDPMQPRARAGFDGLMGDMPFKEIVPKEVYQVSTETLAFHELLSKAMKRNFALNDLLQLAQARAIGSGSDNIEQILGNVGPIIEDMSRSMEPSMAMWGHMEKFLVLQNLSTRQIMSYVGEDGVTPELFDYNPDSLVPSHVATEDPDKGESRYTRIERAKIFANNLKFLITPHSLHELTQMAQKLLLIQLKKAGIKIDSGTIAEACNLPNYGEFKGSTILEKYHDEQEQDLLFMARMKHVAEGVPGLIPQGGAGKNPEGRPATNKSSPKLQQKDGGSRSTIASSGQ